MNDQDRSNIKKKKNIFLTGAPSSGKTTVIKKLISLLPTPAAGFYTEEKRDRERRVGFLMKDLAGREGFLAHQDIGSEYHIRRYGVSIENIESLAVPAILPRENTIIILDEIGKMECFSEKFRAAALAALDSRNIIVGTIALGGGDFIESLKNRLDMEIIEVTLANRDTLPGLLLAKIRELKETCTSAEGGAE
jgi:nucleoside-triphosphatase